jgi:uncharacterized membrane protein
MAWIGYVVVRWLVRVVTRAFRGVAPAVDSAGRLQWIDEVAALVAAAVVGTATNTVGVLGMGVVRGYWASEVALTVGVTQGVPEAVVAAIVTVAVVVPIKLIDLGRAKARM